MSSAARHRAPCWWWPEEGGVVTVAELLERNQDQLAWYWLAQYRREHASHARRVVVPRPRTPTD
jgi:hypothetical protein